MLSLHPTSLCTWDYRCIPVLFTFVHLEGFVWSCLQRRLDTTYRRLEEGVMGWKIRGESGEVSCNRKVMLKIGRWSFFKREWGIFDDSWHLPRFCLWTESWYSQQLLRPPPESGSTGSLECRLGNFQTCAWSLLRIDPDQPSVAWQLGCELLTV